MPDDVGGVVSVRPEAAAEALHHVLEGTGLPLPAGAEPRGRVAVGL